MWLSVQRKISRRKQNAPQIFDTVIDLIISQIQANRFLDRLADNQPLDFVPCRLIRLVNESLYQIISACINPIGLRLCFLSRNISLTWI